MRKLVLIAGLLVASGIAAHAQCSPWFDPLSKQITCAPTNFPSTVTIGTTVVDPANGIKGPLIACVGAPGNTTGPYGSLCDVRATGALWACTNAAGCTVAADWAAVGGAGGSSGITPYQEVPAGAVDGVNRAYTLSQAPSPPATLLMFRNGMAQSLTTDYTLSGNTVTTTVAATPQTGDVLLAYYSTATSGSAISWSTLTSGQWSSLTSGQWSALVL